MTNIIGTKIKTTISKANIFIFQRLKQKNNKDKKKIILHKLKSY